MRPRYRVVIVRRHLDEAGLRIQGASRFHVGEGVEQHGTVTRLFGVQQGLINQQTPYSKTCLLYTSDAADE